MFFSKIYRKFFEIGSQIASFLRIIHYRFKYPRLKISLGCFVSKGCIIACADDSEMILENVFLAPYVHLKADSGGKLSIRDSFIGNYTVIVAINNIEINSHCAIAEMVVIRDQDHVFADNKLLHESGYNSLPIKIEKNVWIGAKATILKGVNVGNNSVIGASAVVTKNVPDELIAIGIPARLIDKR